MIKPKNFSKNLYFKDHWIRLKYAVYMLESLINQSLYKRIIKLHAELWVPQLFEQGKWFIVLIILRIKNIYNDETLLQYPIIKYINIIYLIILSTQELFRLLFIPKYWYSSKMREEYKTCKLIIARVIIVDIKRELNNIINCIIYICKDVKTYCSRVIKYYFKKGK